jgi:hypothetical protein
LHLVAATAAPYTALPSGEAALRHSSTLRAWLIGASPVAFSAYTIVAAFSTYFCMYAFRKPFAAGTFEGTVDIPGVGPISYKVVLIISQVVGYCLSKFIGIKVISELEPSRRALGIVACIAWAWAALLLFAVVPKPYNAACLFLNGLPLGMIWGLVFGFLEGRRVSEVLGAGLSASYILASGAVKGVGKLLIGAGISEFWMPFATGALFALPMLGFVWMLSNLPKPSKADEDARMRREPMDAEARRTFFMSYAPGLVALTSLYVLLTAYRDVRDNFAVEIWAALGYSESPAILAVSEVPITVAVLVVLALLITIRDNRMALVAVHVIMLAGSILIGASTVLFQAGYLDPAWWMILVGLGLYVGYVPYGCVLFDRLLAAVGAVGTAGFLIYLTDAFGYLGSVVLMLYKDLVGAELSWLEFFTNFSYVTSIYCTAAFAVSAVYFSRKAYRPVTAADS